MTSPPRFRRGVFYHICSGCNLQRRKRGRAHRRHSRYCGFGVYRPLERSRFAESVSGRRESIGGIIAAYDNTTTSKIHRDLAIRGRAERTQQSYSRYVSELARYYHRSPELISYQEVADWLYYLIKERELSASSVNIAVNVVRFLYGVTLERNTDQLMASVPRMKNAIRRAAFR